MLTSPTRKSQMNLSESLIALNEIEIDRALELPVYIQLVQQMRSLIVSRRIEQGLRLPSSRDLANDLSLARKTVVSAYDQLIAEGYLSARSGSGTFVEEVSFNDFHEVPAMSVPTPPDRKAKGFGEAMALSPTTPDIDHFPRTAWAKAAAKGQRSIPLSPMFEAPNGGYPQLRETLASHLWAMRGIRCDPRQVIITAGLREALGLVCSKLIPKGCHVVTEDPGYQAYPQTLKQFGLIPIYAQIDDDGLDVDDALSSKHTPAAICVSASRQYPTGAALSLKRRAQLVAWAAQTNGWLIEDDYDCEFRFDGPPLQSMFAMDSGERTIYFGSLSKTLFPRLRLSFLIAPLGIATELIEEQNQRGSLASITAEAGLAEFIRSGQYATHIRQMRRLYANRFEQTFALVDAQLGDWVDPQPCTGGFHFAAYFKSDIARLIDDKAFASAAHAEKVGIKAISSLSASGPVSTSGFLVGFAGTDLESSKVAVQKLRRLFQQQLSME